MKSSKSRNGIWIVYFIRLKNGKNRFKVTRSISKLGINETLLFEDEKEATEQFELWRNN